MNVSPIVVTTKNPFPPLSAIQQPKRKQKQKHVNAPMLGAIAGAVVSPHLTGAVLPHVLTTNFLEKIVAGDKKTKLLYVVGMSAFSAAISGLGALAGKGVEKIVEKIHNSKKGMTPPEPEPYGHKTPKK